MARPVSAHGTLAEVARRVPKGVVSPALRFHDLTTQAPFEVWLAIGNKAARQLDTRRCASCASPARRWPRVSKTWTASPSRVTGVAKAWPTASRVPVRISLDVALEALREAWNAKRDRPKSGTTPRSFWLT
ncbi:MAG: hypothetical protein R2817_15150 [Flavobacteriales bacterium]